VGFSGLVVTHVHPHVLAPGGDSVALLEHSSGGDALVELEFLDGRGWLVGIENAGAMLAGAHERGAVEGELNSAGFEWELSTGDFSHSASVNKRKAFGAGKRNGDQVVGVHKSGATDGGVEWDSANLAGRFMRSVFEVVYEKGFSKATGGKEGGVGRDGGGFDNVGVGECGNA